jgi:hypothetical protein
MAHRGRANSSRSKPEPIAGDRDRRSPGETLRAFVLGVRS